MKLSGITAQEKITAEHAQELTTQMQAGTISKGSCFREMFANGMSIQEIAKVTGEKYQHIYNVCKNEVLKNGLETEASQRTSGETKKSKILAALAEGKTLAEISRDLNCLYNQVWQVAKVAGYTGKKVEVK